MTDNVKRKYPSRAWSQAEPFYFIDDKGDVIEILVSYGEVRAMKKTKKSRIALKRISPTEAEIKP